MAATAILIFANIHFLRHRYVPSGIPNSPPILVMIGQIVKKWQQFYEIQDGGGHNLEL